MSNFIVAVGHTASGNVGCDVMPLMNMDRCIVIVLCQMVIGLIEIESG